MFRDAQTLLLSTDVMGEVVLVLHELAGRGFEVFTEVIMKNAVFWDVPPCGCYKINDSRARIASIIRMKTIRKLGMLTVTTNRSTMRRNTAQCALVARYCQRCS
jgi:hypothetical protein